MLRFASLSGPLGLFRNWYSIRTVANPEMMVDISALFGYKGEARILGFILERGFGVSTHVRPFCCVAHSPRSLASSGSSFANVVVADGSSSVVVQRSMER